MFLVCPFTTSASREYRSPLGRIRNVLGIHGLSNRMSNDPLRSPMTSRTIGSFTTDERSTHFCPTDNGRYCDCPLGVATANDGNNKDSMKSTALEPLVHPAKNRPATSFKQFIRTLLNTTSFESSPHRQKQSWR